MYMKNKLITIILSFLVPMGAFAADNASLNSDVDIAVGGVTLNVVGDTKLNKLIVSGDTFQLIMDGGQVIVIESTDKRLLTIPEVASVQQKLECFSDRSKYTITNPTGGVIATSTISVETSTCAGGGGGSPGGSSGSSGSSSGSSGSSDSSPNLPPPAPVIVPTPVVTPVVVPTAPVASVISPLFTRSLFVGTAHPDVMRLQQLLNSDPDTQIASFGVGSSGNETTYFGSLTTKAIQRFQLKYGVVSSSSSAGYGNVGPLTRAKLNEVFGSGVSAPSTTPTPVTVSALFTSGLERGMSNADIKRLQQLLNSGSDTRIASSGVGSPGNETEFFGSLTEKAVAVFQMKHGLISSSSDPGYGYVGPKTRAKLNEVFGSVSTPAPAAPTASVSDDAAREALQKQINDAMAQVEALLQQIQATQ
jgi:peptidoglycan hydrolase-like protein with peptidoglycan-binding domain